MVNKATFEARSKEEKICTLVGAAYYSHVHEPDMQTARRFNSTPRYVLQLGLEGDQLDRAKEIGLRIKEPTEYIPLPHVEIKRNVKDMSDPQASKPMLVDSMQNSIPSSILIGNGSTVACRFGTYWWEAGGKSGVGTNLFKTQVRNLIPYESKGTSEVDEVTSGWTLDAGGSTTQSASDSSSDYEPYFDDAVEA
jgi:hypothetical protein